MAKKKEAVLENSAKEEQVKAKTTCKNSCATKKSAVNKAKTSAKAVKDAKQAQIIEIKNKKSVLFVASEGLPFIKTGGLADVIGSLPKELAKRGNYDVSVIMPLYSKIDAGMKANFTFEGNFNVALAWRNQYCGLFSCRLDGITFYFIDNEFYFKRGGAYGYYDDGERFAYLDRAVLEAILHIKFAPDIIHCNDWHTGMIPVLMRHFYYGTPAFAKTVFSIHNLKFQGIFPMQTLTELLGLDYGYFEEEKLKYGDSISFMKGGIIFSDAVNTVSPTYATEIRNDFFGEGLDGVLNKYESKLCGILNGIDYDLFNPATDSAIFENYSVTKPENKVLNKLALQDELGLYRSENTPLIGIVSRLTAQKGFDLVIAMIEEIMAETKGLLQKAGTLYE